MPTLHDVLVDRLEQMANEFSTLVAELLAERESIPPDQRAGAYDERFIELIHCSQAPASVHPDALEDCHHLQ
jgi:hypothetical protein